MSSVITSVLKLTFGLLWKKVRDVTANRLQEGEVTDQKCRELIVRELDDIKTKLDSLARKDLLSSISFLKEGLCLVNFAIHKTTGNEEAKEKEDNLQDEASSILKHGGNFDVHDDWPLVLSEAAQKLKIISEKSFVSAEASFKASREEATRAFSNEALPIEDRILATKLRVISRILQSLEEPDAAVDACRLYIKELHDVPCVKEMFSVYVKGGMKSFFNKSKRFESVMSVTKINLVLFDFACKFTKVTTNLFNWPRIEHDEGTYHPMILNKEIMENVKQSGGPRPVNHIIDVDDSRPRSVNSKREVVTWDNTLGDIKVLNTTTSEWRLFCTLADEMIGPNGIRVWGKHSAIAVDGDDNVYIVVKFETRDGVYHYTLFVFDKAGNLKYECTLKFLEGKEWFSNTSLVLSKDRCIIHRWGNSKIWVCDLRGKLKYNFVPKNNMHPFLTVCVSDKNEIIAAQRLKRSVYIHTEKGERKRRFIVPEGHKVCQVAFNHITKTVIVGTWLNNSYFLTSYSETGEQQDALEMPTFLNLLPPVRIISHPSGPVVLVQGNQFVFIQ